MNKVRMKKTIPMMILANIVQTSSVVDLKPCCPHANNNRPNPQHTLVLNCIRSDNCRRCIEEDSC